MSSSFACCGSADKALLCVASKFLVPCELSAVILLCSEIAEGLMVSPSVLQCSFVIVIVLFTQFLLSV